MLYREIPEKKKRKYQRDGSYADVSGWREKKEQASFGTCSYVMSGYVMPDCVGEPPEGGSAAEKPEAG